MSPRELRTRLGVLAGVTAVTAYGSYGYFHIDEYFQVLELVRYKNGDIGEPLPWEVVEHLRPWLQPTIYYGLVRLLGLHDVWTMAFVLRLLTGLANVGAVALLLRTTLPWLASDASKRLHVRVLTGLGFLPYLFVRTSSESASMAALAAGFALLFRDAEEREGAWTLSLTPDRALGGGLLLGAAFEFRFQTAFVSLGILGWLGWWWWRARAFGSRLLLVGAGGALAVGLGALADRWGYGRWELPAWTYFQANILEGASGMFGTDPPFSYLWMSPANVFAPVVLAVMVLVAVAWRRRLGHPLTAATLPFVLVHCLIAHKEERFLFPVVTLAAALVAFSGVELGRSRRFLEIWSVAGMAVLALVPFHWQSNVRFTRFVHDQVDGDFRAVATPEINLNLPPYRPRVYDVRKATARDLAQEIEAHAAPEWLVMDRPDFRDAPELEGKATLVYSELPLSSDPAARARLMTWVDAYNAHLRPPLRPVHFRSLFRLAR